MVCQQLFLLPIAKTEKTHGMSMISSFTYSKDRKGYSQRDESDVRAGYAIW